MLNALRTQTVALLGGSGLVGRALANTLEAAGVPTRVLTRSREHARALWPLPHVDCIELDYFDAAALARGLSGCTALVNLVGILNEQRDDGRGFERAHVTLTQAALEACQKSGVATYVMLSALNAAPQAASHYLRTKGHAEMLVGVAPLRTIILRPSVIFGPGDGLFTRFAQLVRWLPLLPLAGANTRFQPIYVGDVARAVLQCLDSFILPHRLRLDLGGPQILTLREIVEYTRAHTGHHCGIIGLPASLARLQAELCEHLPGKPFSRDNWRSLQRDSIVREIDGLAYLQILATPLEAVVPLQLAASAHHLAYAKFRQRAGR